MSIRKEAWDILDTVMQHGGYAGLLMRHRLNDAEKADVALATQLVYGTLQRQRYVRYQWERFPNGKLPRRIATLLDMSVYQLLFLDKIPAYAVVHEAVSLAKTVHGRYGSVVNGILRSFLREGERSLPNDPIAALAIRTSHPDWLLHLWKAQYGEERMTVIAESALRIKPMAARVNPMQTTIEALLQDGRFQRGRLAKYAVIGDGALPSSDWVKRHDISIQDEASQMAVEALDPRPGMRILDMCAAPGTKSVQMAEWMRDRGTIFCLDIHPHRVELVKQAKDSRHLQSLHPVCMDATTVGDVYEAGSFDAVLLDAPCSGLGVLAQKPDIKARIKPENIDELVALQRRLWEAAVPMVKPGGVLVYSTCTLNQKENERQAKALTEAYPEMELVREHTYFPDEFDTDGFYIAKFINRKRNL